MAITQSDRKCFVGAHVTAKTKRALQREAIVQGKSMSLLISEAVEQKLATSKVDASSKGTK